MIYPKDYTGCKVTIRDADTNAIIGKTTVLDFDKKELTITVDSKRFDLTMYKHLILDIFVDSSIHEYKGTFRRTRISNQIDISVFQGRVKEERISKRYPVNTTAMAKLSFPNRQPFEVQITNISSNGILIKARANCFDVNDKLTVYLEIEDSPTELECQVVRITDETPVTSLYGCKFL